MKLGEIKVECLKLMVIETTEINFTNLESFDTNENYSLFYKRLNGSINRCLGDIEKRCILPLKTTELVVNDGVATITESDFYRIKQVNLLLYGNLYDDISYQKVGNTLYLPSSNGRYVMEYYPKITRVLSTDNKNTEVDLPDYLCELIPFYVKGEIYIDDVNEQITARNYYESKIAEYRNDDGYHEGNDYGI